MSLFRQMINQREDKKIKNKNVTLQVRIPRENQKNCWLRAFPSAFQALGGSMTIEAALVLPLFLFAMVTIMMMFTVMDRQRQVQTAVEAVCEDISRLAYANYEIKRGETKINTPDEEYGYYFREGLIGQVVTAAYVEVRLRNELKEKDIESLSLAGSRFLEDGEMVDLVAVYKIRLPFPVFRMKEISMVSRSSRRAWIGKDGGWLKGSEGDDEEILVYVGKGSTRYHRSRTCHYLYNQLISVALESIDSYRNTSGGKYSACSRCGEHAGQTVYIMKSGSSYHSTSSCSSITAYVRAVKISEVIHLGACTYCSGGEG